VKATNEVGDSVFSDETSIALAPLPAKIANPPTIDLIRSSNSGLMIVWQGFSSIALNAGDIPTLGYKLYMDNGNNGDF